MKTCATALRSCRRFFLPSLLLSCALLPLAGQAQDELTLMSEEDRQVLSLDAVPTQVMASARAAAPDVFFNAAETYWKNDFHVYTLSGRLFREVWRVHVREDGLVLRTESDNQDD